MGGRIVLLGASGYTGDLTARAMAERGLRPVLAGRGAERLRALGDELGGLATRVVDVTHEGSLHGIVARGDVLVTTVGPFVALGEPAVRAAVAAGAHYIDAAGEPGFLRAVFERHGPDAEAAGCALVTAFGYDWVPGNLAATLALGEAGEAAARVEVGYFAPGNTGSALSPGTRATLASIALERAFAWRGGRLVTVPSSSRWRTFELPSGRGEAISVGSTEHFTLPRLHPGLRDVNVYIGWLGWASRPSQALVLATSVATATIPGLKAGLRGLVELAGQGSSSGPGPAARARTRSLIIAEARDRSGALLSEVRLEGPNPYELSASLLAWGAEGALGGRLRGVGALGPVEAWGLDALEAAVAEAGMHRV